MTECIEENDDELLLEEEESVEDKYQSSPSEARRRLESLLAEKKLRDELEDFFDADELD